MLMSGKSELSVYIHIPFCTRKCPYCQFYSITADEATKEQYFLALCREIELQRDKLQNHEIVSLYCGGGTPPLLGTPRLEQLLKLFPACPEVTIELNPEQASKQLAEELFAIGFNRVSVGVQSFHDNELKALGRPHSAHQARMAITSLFDAGFRNISSDLMYEIPYQTLVSWQQTLSQIESLPLTHVSLYNLTIEPGTPFERTQETISQLVPAQEIGVEMYQLAQTKLSDFGFKQYEISAFAKNNMTSRHNSGYWTGRPFLGFGPAAFSFYDGVRFRNCANLSKYIESLREGKLPQDFHDDVTPFDRKRELLVLNLRLLEGVNADTYSPLPPEVEKLISMGLLEQKAGYLKLTDRGVLFYDEVASELI